MNIRELRGKFGKSQRQMSEETGIPLGRINMWEQRNIAPPKAADLEIVTRYFQGLESKASNLTRTEAAVEETRAEYNVKSPIADVNAAELPYSADIVYEKTSDGSAGVSFSQLDDDHYLMSVPIVDQFASAGYAAGWNDVEYLDELPKHVFIVGKEHKGVYRAFRVRGDSMYDGSIHSLPSGSIATGRRIDKAHYTRNAIHISKWRFYAIVREEGIVIKEIVEHDVAKGRIKIRSLNPDKRLYPDQEIRMSDVIEIYNIVSKEIPA